MNYVGVVVAAAIAFVASGAVAVAEETPAAGGETPQQRLLDGNKRFVEAQMTHSGLTPVRRVEVAEGHNPFAAVLSCSDARVPPEVIFDQGLGDLFVVRLAGNIADDAVIGSLEFAVEKLGVRYILVLGHERCDAVETTLDLRAAWIQSAPQPPPIPGHVDTLIRAIDSAVTGVPASGDAMEAAMQANVRAVAQKIKTSAPVLKPRVDAGTLTVVGARYDLDNGQVTILP